MSNVISVRDTLEQALEALEKYEVRDDIQHEVGIQDAIAALKEAIKRQGEPVGIIKEDGVHWKDWFIESVTEETKIYTSAQTMPEDVENDAARYRWLRDHCTNMENPSHTWIVESPGDLWNDAIDAAMLSTAQKGE